MKKENQAQKKAEALLDSLDRIEQVAPPPFFADKVMRQVTQSQSIEVQKVPFWGMPATYAAALALLILVNAGILYTYVNSQEESSLESFAESYGLMETWDESGLNL